MNIESNLFFDCELSWNQLHGFCHYCPLVVYLLLGPWSNHPICPRKMWWLLFISLFFVLRYSKSISVAPHVWKLFCPSSNDWTYSARIFLEQEKTFLMMFNSTCWNQIYINTYVDVITCCLICCSWPWKLFPIVFHYFLHSCSNYRRVYPINSHIYIMSTISALSVVKSHCNLPFLFNTPSKMQLQWKLWPIYYVLAIKCQFTQPLNSAEQNNIIIGFSIIQLQLSHAMWFPQDCRDNFFTRPVSINKSLCPMTFYH